MHPRDAGMQGCRDADTILREKTKKGNVFMHPCKSFTMERLVVTDSKGRVTLPIPPEMYNICWIKGKLYLVDSGELLQSVTSLKEGSSIFGFFETHRVKGLPSTVPRYPQSGRNLRLTIPKVVRVSNLWRFYETELVIEGKKFKAYCLEPCKAVPLQEGKA